MSVSQHQFHFTTEASPPAQLPSLKMASNRTVWLTAKRAPLTIEPAPLLDPGPNQILIKNHAVAINPVDWALQDMEQDLFPSLKFPCTLGLDVAGTVIALGSAVTRVKVGDRVLGLAAEWNELGAFQEYTLLADNLFSPIPDSISFEEASVIPVGLSTSASGMFQKDYLALPHPSVDPKPLGKTLLIWSGASSVGCNAIQLGVAAGCDVVTTCSPKNYELVKKLGASQAFDYNSDTVVSDILTYLEDKTLVGAVGSTCYNPYPCRIEFPSTPFSVARIWVPAKKALTVGNINAIHAGHGLNAAKMVLEIVSKAKGHKFVAMAVRYEGPIPDGVASKFIWGTSLAENEVGAAIYADYLPKALAERKFIPAPEPLVVGKGLESIQKAFDVQRKGVSAKKVVVSL